MGNRILTNRHNLPETLVKAVQYDTHNLAGSISVTTLIDGPRIRYLKALHDYESDVVDNIYALLGTSLHHILERANIDSMRKRAFILTAETLISEAEKMSKDDPEGSRTIMNGANWVFQMIQYLFPEVAERYIFEKTMRMPLGSDHVLSGTFDLYDKQTGILYDYKFCSTYAYTVPESRKKWTKQLNIYAAMLMDECLPVNDIRVVAFFRDWNENGLLRSRDYPDMQIKEIPIPVWTRQQTQTVIDHHINLHRRAEAGDVPDCTGEDRWAKADEYAVKNKKLKRSIRNFDSKAAAVTFMQDNKHKHDAMYIEERPGGSTRCQKYCPVSKYCPQFKAELEREAILAQNK